MLVYIVQQWLLNLKLQYGVHCAKFLRSHYNETSCHHYGSPHYYENHTTSSKSQLAVLLN